MTTRLVAIAISAIILGSSVRTRRERLSAPVPLSALCVRPYAIFTRSDMEVCRTCKNRARRARRCTCCMVQSEAAQRVTPVLSLTIMGAPRTKKTHNRIILVKGGRPQTAQDRHAVRGLGELGERRHAAHRHADCDAHRSRCPLPDRAYNCAAIFYRDANRGDAVGYYQGLADVLEKAQVVTNDKYITQWDGSRMLIDREPAR
jgi:hypothetical protein